MDLSSYLMPYGIELTGVLSLDVCTVRKPYLLTRAGFELEQSDALFVQLFAVPYLTPAADDPTRNLSACARIFPITALRVLSIIPPLMRFPPPLTPG